MTVRTPGVRKAPTVRVNHCASSSQGMCPAPARTTASPAGKRPANSAAWRGRGLVSTSPATTRTGASTAARAATVAGGSKAPGA